MCYLHGPPTSDPPAHRPVETGGRSCRWQRGRKWDRASGSAAESGARPLAAGKPLQEFAIAPLPTSYLQAHEDGHAAHTHVGTPGYASPEVMQRKGHGAETDWRQDSWQNWAAAQCYRLEMGAWAPQPRSAA